MGHLQFNDEEKELLIDALADSRQLADRDAATQGKISALMSRITIGIDSSKTPISFAQTAQRIAVTEATARTIAVLHEHGECTHTQVRSGYVAKLWKLKNGIEILMWYGNDGFILSENKTVEWDIEQIKRLAAIDQAATPSPLEGTTQAEFDAVTAIIAEVRRAITIHPVWPLDLLHCTSILTEEVGELNREALRLVYEPETATFDDVVREATHVGATALRFLMEQANMHPINTHPDKYEQAPPFRSIFGAGSMADSDKSTLNSKVIDQVLRNQLRAARQNLDTVFFDLQVPEVIRETLINTLDGGVNEEALIGALAMIKIVLKVAGIKMKGKRRLFEAMREYAAAVNASQGTGIIFPPNAENLMQLSEAASEQLSKHFDTTNGHA